MISSEILGYIESLDFWHALFENKIWLLLLVALWMIPIKGMALWKAAKGFQRGWFTVLFTLDILMVIFFAAGTLGILDALYIVVFRKFRKKTIYEEALQESNRQAELKKK